MSPTHKRFRIETRGPDSCGLDSRGSGQAGQASDLGCAPQRRLDERRPRGGPHPAALSTPDLVRLQRELTAMKDAIAATKREVASIQHSTTGRDGVHRAASELDAVFDATERATTTILGAAEEIESAVNMMRASSPDTGRNDFLGTILDRVVLLYETCNFQDITGQRIEKVVGTLKFVEERLDAMIEAWGSLVAPEPETGPLDETGRRLAHGPGLPGDDLITQSDIDSYFG